MSAKLLGAAFEAVMPTHAAKLVLLKLVDEARDDGSRCFPSVGRIASAAQCSRRHVQRMLRKFEKVGLVTVVAEGGAGRGDTTEYALSLDVLAAIGKVGWQAATGVADTDSDDDPVSPNEDGAALGESDEKGVTVSPLAERATSETLKGDIGDKEGRQAMSPNPLRDPLKTPEERDARADFERLLRDYPDAAADDIGTSRRIFTAMPDADQIASAGEGLERFRDFLKGQRRRPPLQDYLRERRWKLVPAKPAGSATPRRDDKVDAFDRSWWWLYHNSAGQGGGQGLRDRVNLAVRYAIGWPVDPDKRDQIEREAEQLVKLHKDSPGALAWRNHYRTKGIDMPLPDKADWIFVPAELPESAQQELEQVDDIR